MAKNKEARSYVEKFRGNGFYTLKKEDIVFVKGRETEYCATVFKLVPPSTMLYTKIAETFHRKYHLLGGSPVYIRTQCSLQGNAGRFTGSFTHQGIWEWLRKYGICHYSRYISLNVVESLSKESVLNSFGMHFLRYGQSTKIWTDFGTNFSAAKETLENAELIDNDDIKKISETLKSEGVTLVQRTPKAPFVQGSVEKANSLIKKILPGKRMNVFQLILLCEFIMYHINIRPILNTRECSPSRYFASLEQSKSKGIDDWLHENCGEYKRRLHRKMEAVV